MKRASLVEDAQLRQSTNSTVYSRHSSDASRLVGCFQELNDRLSAFERLAQLKQMVMDGKLKQDVFEEMYRINTEKLVEHRKGRSKLKKFEVSAISVLDDFCVKHRALNPNPSILELASVAQLKMKRGCLYFDRIVLRSASTFGSSKETILIGTLPMTLMFYDDEPSRVDLQFEKRHEQFVFDSEIEMLMFVEALDKALDTAARSCTSKDEPVLLGRPMRSRSQTLKDLESRKTACMTLEGMLSDGGKSGSAPSLLSAKSFATSTSTLVTRDSRFDLVGDDDDDDHMNDDMEAKGNVETGKDEDQGVEEEKEEEKDEDRQPSKECRQVELPQKAPHGQEVIAEEKAKIVSFVRPTPVVPVEWSPSSRESSPVSSPSGDAEEKRRCEERAKMAEMLGHAKREREEALLVLEQKKLAAAQAREAEQQEQAVLERIRAEEDLAIKDALAARDEDVQAAKNLADCVANEIAALNALDPDDVVSTATSRSNNINSNNDDTNFPMSNDLRALIGKPPVEQSPMSPYAKLHFNLQQARKALAAARTKVEKSSEKRRILEAARRDARKKVTAQMARGSQVGKQVASCEGGVLAAKAALTRIEDRVGHFEHCLLISVTHELQKQKLFGMTFSRPSSPVNAQCSSPTPSTWLTGTSTSASSTTTPSMVEVTPVPFRRESEKPEDPMAVLESTLIT